MKRLLITISFCFISAGSLLFAQMRKPPQAPMPARHYEIRSGVRREELSKRIEQRRSELRREDHIRDRRKIDPRGKDKR